MLVNTGELAFHWNRVTSLVVQRGGGGLVVRLRLSSGLSSPRGGQLKIFKNFIYTFNKISIIGPNEGKFN